MSDQYEHLDAVTRGYMLQEIGLGPVPGTRSLTPDGADLWPALLAEAAHRQTARWLAEVLVDRGLVGRAGGKAAAEAERVATSTFQRYYLRALCRRAADAGFAFLVVTRGTGSPKPEGAKKVGTRVPVTAMLKSLRRDDGYTLDTALGLPPGGAFGLTCRLPTANEAAAPAKALSR